MNVIKVVVPNISAIALMSNVTDVYEVDAEQAHYAVTSAARELGYPAPLVSGIWPRDAFALLKLVDRRLS